MIDRALEVAAGDRYSDINKTIRLFVIKTFPLIVNEWGAFYLVQLRFAR